MTPQPSGTECYTDFALQEHLAGRLDHGVRRELEEHLARCPECRQALQSFGAEADLLHRALELHGEGEAPPEELLGETLARYLSGALDDSQAAALEETLSRQPALLARLVALGREVAAVRKETGLGIQVEEQRPPEGLILRMQQRTKPPITMSLPTQLGEDTGS